MSTLLAKGFYYKPQTCSGIQIITLQDLQILFNTDISKFISFGKTKCIRYRKKLSVPIYSDISSELFLVHKDETYKITHTLATFLRCIDASIFPDDDDLQNDLIHLESQLEDLHGLFLIRCGAFVKKIKLVTVDAKDKFQEDSCDVTEVPSKEAVNDDPTQSIDTLDSLEGCKSADVSTNDNDLTVGETVSCSTKYSCQTSSMKDFKCLGSSASKTDTLPSRFDIDYVSVDEKTKGSLAIVEVNFCSTDLIVFDDSFIGYTNEFLFVKDNSIYDSFTLFNSSADKIFSANPFENLNVFEQISYSNCSSDDFVDDLEDVKETFTKIVVFAVLDVRDKINIFLFCVCYQPILIKPQPTDKPPP